MADYAAKPRKAKEDTSIIDLRKRMLGVFLNRCRKMKEVVEDGVWWRFLDPNSSWVLAPHDFLNIYWADRNSERSSTLSSCVLDSQE